MELEEFGPDDRAAVDEYVALSRDCVALDCPWEVPPTVWRLQLEMRFGWDGERARYFLLRDAGRAVGTLCFFGPERDNLELAWIELRIAPAFRRRGFGRAALGEASQLALSVGRPSMIFDQGWDSPAVQGFAAALELGLGQVLVRRAQDLDGSAEERERFIAQRAEAEAHSTGYDLVRVLGCTPPELLDGLVEATRAINDAPIDDLDYEDEIYDADRIRAFEQAQSDAGFRLRRVIAVERSTGAVAGHTLLSVYSEQPEYAEQDDTTVLAGHRGNRLGLRLKADMLCWLAADEPQLRRILTQNAESNEPMIAVNERLGYRIVGREMLHQRRLA